MFNPSMYSSVIGGDKSFDLLLDFGVLVYKFWTPWFFLLIFWLNGDFHASLDCMEPAICITIYNLEMNLKIFDWLTSIIWVLFTFINLEAFLT